MLGSVALACCATRWSAESGDAGTAARPGFLKISKINLVVDLTTLNFVLGILSRD